MIFHQFHKIHTFIFRRMEPLPAANPSAAEKLKGETHAPPENGQDALLTSSLSAEQTGTALVQRQLSHLESQKQAGDTVDPTGVVGDIPSDSDVVLIGEVHGEEFSAIPKLTTRMLPLLKQKGFTTLAIEVDDKYQPFYDDYMRDRITLEELAQKAPVAKFRGEDHVVREVGKTLFETAKRLGFKIICVDHMDFSDDKVRDEYMAGYISQCVQGGEKVVFYVGAAHASESKGPPPGKIERMVHDVDDSPTGLLLSQGDMKVHSIAFNIDGVLQIPPDMKYDRIYTLK